MPRFCSTQSQLVGSELFSYCPMRIQLTPASNMRVHHQRSHGRYGSRGRLELMPNPLSIWDDRFGGTREGCAKQIPVTNQPMRNRGTFISGSIHSTASTAVDSFRA